MENKANNRYVSLEEFERLIKKYFVINAKMSIAEAKRRIKKQLKIDKYGNVVGQSNSIRAGNVIVFYATNPNFAGGVKNGYGKGWYISDNRRDIKLSKTTVKKKKP
jgi:hypothetical protein